MYRVAREIDFCYGHRLLDYDGKCRHLHGHNGRAIITLEASGLDHRGMMVDFGDIKRDVQTWIDDNLDHNLLAPPRRPDPADAQGRGASASSRWTTTRRPRTSPDLIFEHASAAAGLPVVEVVLWETERCHAAYGEPIRRDRRPAGY